MTTKAFSYQLLALEKIIHPKYIPNSNPRIQFILKIPQKRVNTKHPRNKFLYL